MPFTSELPIGWSVRFSASPSFDARMQQIEFGINWQQIHAKYSSKLNDKMSRVQLFEVLCQMLSELKDGHVNISTSLDLGRNWSWKEDYPENLNTELRNKYLGTDYHIGSGLKYTILPDNIAYVVYESFSSGVGEGNLSDMIAHLRLCNGMILDIRGNSGGELSNAEKLSERFTNEHSGQQWGRADQC